MKMVIIVPSISEVCIWVSEAVFRYYAAKVGVVDKRIRDVAPQEVRQGRIEIVKYFMSLMCVVVLVKTTTYSMFCLLCCSMMAPTRTLVLVR